MHKSECPVCGSAHTMKNGVRNGRQTYRCADCGHQFRNGRLPCEETLWKLYQENKQTVNELAERFSVSPSTIKRRLRNVTGEWEQPPLGGSGFVHLDATYWGRNSGLLLAMDSRTGQVLYLSFIRHECANDYMEAVESIERRGYTIRGLVIDGTKSLFKLFAGRRIQMCQFHMMQIIRRYIRNSPRLLAARELKELVAGLCRSDRDTFSASFNAWKEKWRETIGYRVECKDGKRRYRHGRLRSAMHSLEYYLPFLFTFQEKDCCGMPNTNNKIEGTFTDLKKNLNTHSGMGEANRKRFVSRFFLALTRCSKHLPGGVHAKRPEPQE